MDKAFYGLTIMDIRVFVFEYCKRNEIDYSFSREIKVAGEDFVRGLLKRHKDLPLRKPQWVVLNRVFSLNKEAVKRYFDKLEIPLNGHHYEPHQIYNCNETGITTMHNPAKVIAPTRKHCVSSMTVVKKVLLPPYRDVPVMHFVISYPSWWFLKEKMKKTSLTDHAPPATIQGCSENGWVNTKVFLEFIQHSVKNVKKSSVNDIWWSQVPHKIFGSLIDYARENGLFLLSLPPHTTHKLQALDRAVFKPLKFYFNNTCQKWTEIILTEEYKQQI